ncbi:Divalent-cation tolerance protein CutA,divalent-cation tolerance protein CutA,CutA1 divalent ion tolerance protein [Chlamydia serpentis]|uniref:Divalent-cation tolerance protein CutA,divalent-cation tolerance protein CutA,CutA1 divalent ion tolerance protein n=1 Tax=Chlamydia serpentis TaxID=1967782 RepID=A0A2R8FCM6_9CHLA|nr:divalent-cation tolerance protein CutA [Chlamydia serpentis]SPN74017.1 Divalent-cation tolerance protein CutA,divalent-cation tolerance protein CutA,CutA1 divalent ion tolerance protein [Chlamydia serpentis]
MTPILILTSFPSQQSAESLATYLITKHLARCVHIFPKGQSMYLWKGKICKSEEHHIQIKTTDLCFPKICKVIKEFCDYEVPEILLFPIQHGDPKYLSWLTMETCSENFPRLD